MRNSSLIFLFCFSYQRNNTNERRASEQKMNEWKCIFSSKSLLYLLFVMSCSLSSSSSSRLHLLYFISHANSKKSILKWCHCITSHCTCFEEEKGDDDKPDNRQQVVYTWLFGRREAIESKSAGNETQSTSCPQKNL